MTWPELALFPPDSVAITLTTTVWFGVLIVTFFNLRLGWTLSGLVIPGYLVPLLLYKPTAVAVIVIESILTFGLVYFVSEKPKRCPGWCSFFGRDRFLALVIGSVVVRALMEGWVLPWLGPRINEWLGIQFDYHNDLHSYGLIIVSLMANYFWKPGIARGLSALATTVGLTYLIVRFPLIHLTNFNVGDLSSIYDDISVSLLASPKAYIIILTAAWISSWLNLKYSWDFNGILVPSLMALLWCSPAKVLMSFVEAGFLLAAAKLVLRLPLFQKTTVEGARRIALFFTICFVHRLLLSHLIPRLWPDALVTDFFGFGYLLSSLLAIRAFQKKVTLHLVFTTVQASTVGALVGSLLGFTMTIVPIAWFNPSAAPADESISRERSHATADLTKSVRFQKVSLYSQRTPGSYFPPLVAEVTDFQRGVEAVKRYMQSNSAEDLRDATAYLRAAHFDLSIVENRYLCLFERPPARGWGLYVFDIENPYGVVIEVPVPLNEPSTFESGFCLFQQLQGSVLAVGGTDRRNTADGSSDVLVNPWSVLVALRERCADRGVLQVRGQTPASLDPNAKTGSELWISRSLPRSVDWKLLESLTLDLDVTWGDRPSTNVLRDKPANGFAELRLGEEAHRRLSARLAKGGERLVHEEAGPLHPWLMKNRDRMAKQHSDLYRPAQLEELLFLDEEVLRPLVQVASDADGLSPSLLDERLANIAAAARLLDYGVTVLRDTSRQREYFVLSEQPVPQRHWGTYVFRSGLDSPFIVEVPRPLLERKAYEFGAGIFQQLDAAALFLSGSHPHANCDDSSDLARLANKTNAFNLVHQCFLREMRDRPMLVIQSRAIRSPVDADVVMATEDGTIGDELTPLKQSLTTALKHQGLSLAQVNGSPSTAGYEMGILLTASSLNHTANKELVSLWVSPGLRGKFRSAEEETQLQAQMALLQIPTLQTDLVDYLQRQFAGRSRRELPSKLQASLNGYLKNRDVVQLVALRQRHPSFSWLWIDDLSTGQIYLVIEPDSGSFPWVFNVSGHVCGLAERQVAFVDDRPAIRDYVDSRSVWLELEEAQR